MLETIRNLPLPQRLGQMFFIGISGPVADAPTLDLLDDISPGGVCLFARNIHDARQTRDLLDEVRRVSSVDPFLSIDQEGGTVDRLRKLITPMAAASRIASEADAADMARLIAGAIRILGFNMDFAPVVDVVDDQRSGSSNGLFTRPFGRSREETARFAGAFFKALQQEQVVGCLKHFPGLGAARVDSHEELPVVDIDRDTMFATDLFPYLEILSGGDVHAVMVAHAAYPAIDLQERDNNGKLLPSSLSANIITTLLRGELDFNGLVLTDDLEMGAILKNYGIGEACVMAIEAGADMLAICAGEDNIREGFAAVRDAFEHGRISDDRLDASLVRIAEVKAKLISPPRFDADALIDISDSIAAFNARVQPN